MKLAKFSIISDKEGLPSKYDVSPILINIDHIVSIRPINIRTADDPIKGYWIRLVNGKKYKAVEIPHEISALFQADDFNPSFNKINSLNESQPTNQLQ